MLLTNNVFQSAQQMFIRLKIKSEFVYKAQMNVHNTSKLFHKLLNVFHHAKDIQSIVNNVLQIVHLVIQH